MNYAPGLNALRELRNKPARRTQAQNRDFVSGLLPELVAAREAGYGFVSMVKSLNAAYGSNCISVSTLKRHYRALMAEGPILCNVGLAQPVEEAPFVTDDEYGFVEGSEYDLVNVADGKTMNVFFRGIQDDKYLFSRIHLNGMVSEKSISKAAMKYYTVTRK